MEQRIALVLVGDAKTGKTSLVNRVITDSFSLAYRPTIGADFLSKKYPDTTLRIWHVAGQERFASINKPFLKEKDAVGIVLAADTLDDNLNTVRVHYDETQKAAADARYYIIVNKTDLLPATLNGEQIDLSSEAGKNTLRKEIQKKLPANAKEFTVLYCSAKTGENVADTFQTIANETFQVLTQQAKKQESDIPPPARPYPPKPLMDLMFEYKWRSGNVLLGVAIVVTLATLASLPIGGLPILFGLSVLAVAGITSAAAFLIYNAVCFIGSRISKGDGGGGGDSEDIEELLTDEESSREEENTQQPDPHKFKEIVGKLGGSSDSPQTLSKDDPFHPKSDPDNPFDL